MTCIRIPGGVVCLGRITIGSAKIDTRRSVQWEFDRRFGPMFFWGSDRERERPIVNPTPRMWDVFMAWLDTQP